MEHEKSAAVRAGPVSEDDLPPPWVRHRGTPRSLTRTLVKLREEGRYRTIPEMAEMLGLKPRTVTNWESVAHCEDDGKPGFTIKVKDLQRYQDLLGIPIGIIIVMSQILADARDQEDERLEVMARMLEALHARIDTKPKRQEAMADVLQGKASKGDTTYAAWDNFLAILIMTVWGSVSYPLREAFKNPDRLKLRASESAALGRKRKRARPKQVSGGA